MTDIKDTEFYQEAFGKGKLEGKLEGKQMGLLEGRFEGMLQGIEMVLESRFGIEGLRLMPEISKLWDMDVLKTIRAALRSAKTIEELRSIYR
jgi:predicted transposase YdaD